MNSSPHGSKTVLADSVSDIKFSEGGWWRRRSCLEKGLLVAVLATFFALIAVAVALIVVAVRTPRLENVCMTEECTVAAARISSMIDKSVDPCQDFFQYACGTWRRLNVIPEDRSAQNMFGLLRDEVDVILKGLLEDKSAAGELEAVEKAKTYYASCLNTTLLEERGAGPLYSVLAEFGGWPVLNPNWTSANFSFLDTLIQLRRSGYGPLIDFSAYVNFKNSSSRVLYIDQPYLGMPGRKYYLRGRDDRMLLAYEKLIGEVAVLLGADPVQAKQDAKELVDFEMQIANISVADEDRRDSEKLYNPTTIEALDRNHTSFNWTHYVTSVMSWAEVDVTASEVVINYSPPYFSKLFPLLDSVSDRTKANYMVWMVVTANANLLTEAFRNLYLDYDKVLSGTSTDRARFRHCVSSTTDTLGLAVGRLFVKQNFKTDAKDTADAMIRGLHDAFNELLEDLDWMDDVTKAAAREKADHIDKKIGFPDTVLDDSFLNKLYANLTYNVSTFFENVQVNRLESSWRYLHRLREPVDRYEWITPPSTVNAYYSSSKNQIMFPAGILQPPFFSNSYPKSLNYGGIGVVIGHEITHGFDDRGRQFDKTGNLEQWWSEGAITKFKAKAQCIVEQYSRYKMDEVEMNVNGVNTQGENIADNGGLKQSFRAYRNWVTEQGKEEPKLPGLNMTNDQLFFVNFAQIWCENMRPEYAISRILTGVHSPGRFRVIGTLQNSADFSKAFSCAKGTYMNPERKCYVW